MKQNAAIFAVTVSVLFSVRAVAGDELCSRLDEFARAPLAHDDKGALQPRSFEFHWKPGGILGAVECVHNSDEYAKPLCKWLVSNTSREFPEALAEDILHCHGFKFPQIPNVQMWKAEYRFSDDVTGRDTYLEIDIGAGRQDVSQGKYPIDQAIRFSVFPKDRDYFSYPAKPLIGSHDPVTSAQ